MNLTDLRLVMVLTLLFMSFLRFSKLSNLKDSDFILHKLISKTDMYSNEHWLHVRKLNSELCPLELTKRFFALAGIDKQRYEYILEALKIKKLPKVEEN